MEATVGYSRAVVAGTHVYVSGTAPIPESGEPPEGAYEQMRLCLQIVRGALERAGASLEDVVRTRVYVTDAAHAEGAGRAHAEAFSEVRPASSMIVVTGLLDPRWLVEIEAEALIG